MLGLSGPGNQEEFLHINVNQGGWWLVPMCPKGVEFGELVLTHDRGNSIMAPQVGKPC